MSEQNGEIGEIRDLEQFNERKRYEDIHDARARVPAVRELISDPASQRQHTLQERQKALYEAVKSYAVELEWQIKDDSEQKYWRNKDLGRVSVHPPQSAIACYEDHEREMPDGATGPVPRVQHVTGLGEFVELDPPFQEEWSIKWGDRNGIEIERFVNTASVPASVSDQAYRACNEFCHEIGIAVTIDNTDEEGQMDYSDLLSKNGEMAGINASRFGEALEKVQN